MKTLDMVKIGETVRVLNVDTNHELKQRLLDIGLVKGATVKVFHKSPSGNPRAYIICGAVIALRNCDAAKIEVVDYE